MSKLIINNIEIDTQYYINKWTNWALEATPATDEQVINNIQTLYSKAKLNKPEVKVYRSYEEFGASVSVGVSVGDSVWASVWDSVWDSVSASVGASVRDSVGDSVRDSIWDSVRASVRAGVRDSIWDSVRASIMAGVGGWHWSDVLAFADVFVDTKILSKEKVLELDEYKKLLETQRLAVLLPDIAHVLVAPTIRRNEDGQLHSDQKPAVEWEDGTGLYYLDGVVLPKDIWQNIISQTMSFSEIMAIEISDQRTVALKYNPQAIIKENATLIHKDNRNNELYLIENQEINKITEHPKMYFVKMLCPTGRIFVEGIEPKFAEANPNATDCQAELCGLTKSEYASMSLES